MIGIIPLSLKQFAIIYSVIAAIYGIFLGCKKLDYKKAKASFFIFWNFTIALLLFYFLQNHWNICHLFMCISIGFGLANILVLKKFQLYKPIHGILFLFLVFFALSFGYISYTPYFARQHDSRNFYQYENGGHFGYIGYLFQNHHLPTGNPTDYWCFFNPPLFYIISAIFLKLQNLIGLEIEIGFENLQLLSLLYAFIFIIYVYRILKKVGVRKSLTVVFAFIICSPALIIMSGSLNNDMLSITLSTIALFYAMQWFETDRLRDLIKIAFAIGLAMMTKVSTALIAIVIAVLFMLRVFPNKNQWKKYLLHFSIFAIIALPIGIWFPIKNWILYQIPPTYVQSIDPNTPINLSSYSATERFFTISSRENVSNVNVIMEGEHKDYNLFFTTLKSFVLDEHIDYSENSILRLHTTYLILSCYYHSYFVYH